MKILDVLAQICPDLSKSEIRRLLDQDACWIKLAQNHEFGKLVDNNDKFKIGLSMDELIVGIIFREEHDTDNRQKESPSHEEGGNNSTGSREVYPSKGQVES